MAENEYDKFMESIENKSENTKKAYKIQYKKLKNMLGKDIGEASQRTLIKTIQEHDNPNGRQALLNIAILIRRLEMYKLSVTELEDLRDKLKEDIKTEVKKKNVNLPKSLPSYEDLVEYTNMLYEQSEWTDYIINYLLLNYNVRNKDLLFDIVRRKKLAKADTTKNYLWLSDSFVEYIRNDYKTRNWEKKKINEDYGPKHIKIKDKKFMTAVRRVFACQKHNEDCGVFIENPNYIGYYLKKATLGGIGETAYNKIIVNHFRKDIDKLEQIAKDRGTNIKTLLEFYDIEKK